MIEQIKKELEEPFRLLRYEVVTTSEPNLDAILNKVFYKAFKLGLQRAIELKPEKRDISSYALPFIDEPAQDFSTAAKHGENVGFNKGVDTYTELLRKELE